MRLIPTSLPSHSLQGVKVPGLVQILLPLLRDPALGLQLSPGLPPLEDPVILLGIDVKRFLLQHLGPGDGESLYGGVPSGVGCGAGRPVGGAGAPRHHHDDVPVVGCPALHLHHPLPGGSTELLELDLLVLPLHLDRLVDQRLAVSGLEDLLAVLYLNDLLLAGGCRQDLDLLGLDVSPGPLDLDLLAARRHVLHDDLLAGGRLYHLLTLACRNHPDNKQIVSSLSSQAILN